MMRRSERVDFILGIMMLAERLSSMMRPPHRA